MLKNIFWVITLLLSLNFVFSNEEYCLKPDEYILKCEFEPNLFEKSFTCLDLNCQNKLYSLDKTLLLAEYPNEEKSIKILKGQVNLNEISHDLNILKTICKQEISDNQIQKFSQKVKQSQTAQTFSGQYLTIQSKKKISIEDPCYDTQYEDFFGFQIESKIPKPYCQVQYNEQTGCFTQSTKTVDYLLYYYKNPTQVSIFVTFAVLLLVSLMIGIVGLFQHLIENELIKDFLKIDKQKIIFSAIFITPIFFFLGKIIDTIFENLYLSSQIIPIIIIFLGLLITYFLSSLIHLVINHKQISKQKKLYRHTKTQFEKRRKNK